MLTPQTTGKDWLAASHHERRAWVEQAVADCAVRGLGIASASSLEQGITQFFTRSEFQHQTISYAFAQVFGSAKPPGPTKRLNAASTIMPESILRKCICVLKNVAGPGANELPGVGDVFLSRDELLFVPYAALEAGSGGIGKFTFAGGLMGGVGGLVVGAVVDQLTHRRSTSPKDTLNAAAQTRSEDYGLSIDDRLKKRMGFLVRRLEVKEVRPSASECCVIEAKDSKLLLWDIILVGDGPDQPKTGLSISRDEVSPLTIKAMMELLSKWQQGQLEEQPASSLEGARIGIRPDKFASALREASMHQLWPILSKDFIVESGRDPAFMKEMVLYLAGIGSVFDASRQISTLATWLSDSHPDLYRSIHEAMRLRSLERNTYLMWSWLTFGGSVVFGTTLGFALASSEGGGVLALLLLVAFLVALGSLMSLVYFLGEAILARRFARWFGFSTEKQTESPSLRAGDISRPGNAP